MHLPSLRLPRLTVFFATVTLAQAAPAAAHQRLVLVGGGTRPAAAMQRFVAWSGGTGARILIVLWATEAPDESFDGLKKDLLPYSPASIERAPIAPVTGDARASALALIRAATGIFFSGGDQNRIMAVLEDQELLQALRDRYAAGVTFGGTSAGTAVVSNPMITGEGDFTVLDGDQVQVKPGLGLLPGVITDQHFIRHSRQNRLFGLVLKSPQVLGVGIDEDTALLVRDNRHCEVVGRGPVLAVDGRGHPGSLLVSVLKPGDGFDLRRRKREERPAGR